MGRWRIAVVVYGLLNAIAYSCLLPLWEGWDEGFHYGYVQYLSHNGRFPVLDQTHLSREIWRAYELTPVSHYLQPYLKAPLNFDNYVRMPEAERESLRAELRAIPVAEGNEPQLNKLDYEVNQSPLPYLFMAPFDWALGARPLPDRVLFLRLVCSLSAVVLLAWAVRLLARELALEEPYETAALFCIFSAQVLYAVFCHICNDWMAVPAGSFLIVATIRAWRGGSTRSWAVAGAAATVALLAKAYLLFIAVLPVAVLAWALWRGRAGLREAVAFALPLGVFAAPWYVRNLVLYRNLTGTTDSTSNLSLALLVKGARELPWRDGITSMAHSSLWTGNNSFTSFSAGTLNLMLAALAAGAGLYFARTRRRPAEWAVVAATALYCCGLASISVAYFVSTKGGLIGTWPWYSQVLLAPVFLIVFLGISRYAPWGRIGLAVYPALWGYVMLSTYFVKLVPQYGGFTGKAHLSTLWRWYWESGAQRDSLLRTTCMAGLGVLWPVMGAIALLAVAICGKLITAASRRPASA